MDLPEKQKRKKHLSMVYGAHIYFVVWLVFASVLISCLVGKTIGRFIPYLYCGWTGLLKKNKNSDGEGERKSSTPKNWMAL